MLYVLYGTDTHTARHKVHRLVDGLLAKKPDASHFRIDEETFTPAQLEEHIGGQGLFARRSIIVLDKVFENQEAQESVLNQLKAIAHSDNIFILFEEKIEKKFLTQLTKHAEKVEMCELKMKPSTSSFNTFSLTDAFGNRDKGRVWVLYWKALRAGVVPEEIHGVLFWQLKTMLRVASGNIDGMKPFVVAKAKGFNHKYRPEELHNLSAEFVSLYHQAHRGAIDLTMGLEQLLLTRL